MASLLKRGKTFYAQYYVGNRQRRVSLHTTSLQIAKEKVRQIESAQARGTDIPLPTRTPLATVVKASLRKNLDQYVPPESEQGWLFPSAKGVRWDVNNFSQALEKINKANNQQ